MTGTSNCLAAGWGDVASPGSVRQDTSGSTDWQEWIRLSELICSGLLDFERCAIQSEVERQKETRLQSQASA